MDIDAYLKEVDHLARVSVDNGIAPQDLIEKPGNHADSVTDCIICRESLLTSQEENDLSGYLVLGLFTGRARRQRQATFAFCFDVQHAADLLTIRRQCERYDRTQALFTGAPELFDKIRTREDGGGPDLELIDLDAVQSVAGSEIYRAGQGFTRLSPYLSPGIVTWARTTYPKRPTFIRLDPHQFHTSQPPQLLTEATLVPANPKWLSGFSLRKGMKDFAAYTLIERPPADSPAEFWDYRIRHLRRLEIHVARRRDDYLSMMIEELPRPDDPNGFMTAQCIHLDTRDPVCTPLDEVELQHLDLALNVYCGDDRTARFDQSLQDGKVYDATFRTHLFRIERAPFQALFSFCEMFLRSRVLLGEWLNELFGDKPDASSEAAGGQTVP